MKTEKSITSTSEENFPKEKITQDSKQKHTTSASINNIITRPAEKVKPRPGAGLANEGTVVSYDEDR